MNARYICTDKLNGTYQPHAGPGGVGLCTTSLKEDLLCQVGRAVSGSANAQAGDYNVNVNSGAECRYNQPDGFMATRPQYICDYLGGTWDAANGNCQLSVNNMTTCSIASGLSNQFLMYDFSTNECVDQSQVT